ncbi:hypothetical protein N8860_00185 [Alphaproteobacteria bacterium]|nr:hypothetical protein [Alphaproteobacteria bacterium]
MTGAIWALAYEILNDDRETYLDWFHRIHIPEKLARPGYRWAAHFEGSATPPDAHSYIALFGGISTRIFLDPSPAQLKPKQDNLTREMMTRRRNPFATILAHEWRDDSTPSTGNDDRVAAEAIHSGATHSGAIHSDWLEFLVIDAAGESEAIGAWAVQTLLPKLQKHNLDAAKTAAVTHKLISVTGGPAHILLYETNQTVLADDNAAASRFDPPATIFKAPILVDMPKAASLCHRSGKRIWPV